MLLVLEMLWGRVTLVIFAVSFDGMPDFKGSLRALLEPENLTFIVAWLAAGAVFAALIFSVSVISIPMLLDRPVDAITAGLTSLRLVLSQPGVMIVWGALISALVVAAMLPWFAGLVDRRADRRPCVVARLPRGGGATRHVVAFLVNYCNNQDAATE